MILPSGPKGSPFTSPAPASHIEQGGMSGTVIPHSKPRKSWIMDSHVSKQDLTDRRRGPQSRKMLHGQLLSMHQHYRSWSSNIKYFDRPLNNVHANSWSWTKSTWTTNLLWEEMPGSEVNLEQWAPDQSYGGKDNKSSCRYLSLSYMQQPQIPNINHAAADCCGHVHFSYLQET